MYDRGAYQSGVPVTPIRRDDTVSDAPTCSHPDCTNTSTDARAGFPFCRSHFFWVLQCEQQVDPAPALRWQGGVWGDIA